MPLNLALGRQRQASQSYTVGPCLKTAAERKQDASHHDSYTVAHIPQGGLKCCAGQKQECVKAPAFERDRGGPFKHGKWLSATPLPALWMTRAQAARGHF